MFSKPKQTETAERIPGRSADPAAASVPAKPAAGPGAPDGAAASQSGVAPGERAPSPPAKLKPAPSLLSEDIVIQGNVLAEGDIQIEGTIEGDVRATMLTVGEKALIRGELVAEDVVVNGHVIGRLRGLKVRLTASAEVEGDIIHRTIAIEAGARFEGSVSRQDDPLGEKSPKVAPIREARTTAAE